MHNRNYSSNLRQTRYGHRGDAHIGGACHPGPKRTSHTEVQDVSKRWACSICTSWNHEDMKSCEICSCVKRPRRNETGMSATRQTRIAPTSTQAPAVGQLAPPEPPKLPKTTPNINRPGAKMSRHSRAKTEASAASAEAVADLSIEETDDAMRMSLLEDQKITDFKLRRHKLLSDALAPQGRHTIDVSSDGSCQSAALLVELTPLIEHPPPDDQKLREWIVTYIYLLANKESLQEGQQLGFQHGDPAHRKGVDATYGDTYIFDKYCTLMRNLVGTPPHEKH